MVVGLKMEQTILRELTQLTLLESRFGDKSVKFQVVCPQNGTAVLKGLIVKPLEDRTAKSVQLL